MADGKIVIETGLDASGIKDGICKIGSIASTGLKTTTAAIGAVSTALMGAGGYAVKVGSDFEAAMSKVEAISGATAEQMDALTQKAKDMGASTKFSATESAEAFQYMAMAGWDSAQMIDGIGGIMNLAAADGLDLATTSDIVTDALTAFGLAASDSTHFADVLATASSNANTNVAMLGESFKYVAPVAGAMNYSVEDVSKALGLMANASVKGSMAGTTLKTSLARMAAPTDKMAKAMEQYGISLTDSEGNMKSLDDVMKNLRKSLGGLSEDEQTAAASTIFGKEAMAGMLAIINASEQDYNKLSDAIANADGTAQRMADTMNNNLQGKVTLAKSALEGLGIQIYETMEDGLKEAVETGTGYIDRLADAFTDGGLEGAVNEAGDVIADLATDIAESAPDMITASTKLINSFVKGIVKNKKELKVATKEVVKALADGLTDMLPKQMQKPAKKAIDSLAKMFRNMATTLGNVASSISRILIPVFNTITKNLDSIGPKAIAAVAALKTFQTVSSVLNGTNSAIQGVGLALQALKAHPVIAVVSAIAALTAGIIVFAATGKEIDETEVKLQESAEAMEVSFSKLGDGISSTIRQIQNADSHIDEFSDTLFASQEELDARAAEMEEVQSKITEITQRASRERRTLTEGETQALDNYFQKLNELADAQLEIERRRTEAISSRVEREVKGYSGSLDQYQQFAAEWQRTAEDNKAKQIEIIDQQTTAQIELIRQKHEAAGTLTSEAYESEVDAAVEKGKREKEIATSDYSEIVRIITEKYQEMGDKQSEYATKFSDINEAIEKEEQRHQDYLNDPIRRVGTEEYEQYYDRLLEKGMDAWDATLKIDKEIEEEEQRHNSNIADLYDQMNNLLSGESAEYIQTLAGMAAETVSQGGVMTDAQRELITSISDTWDQLPDDTRDDIADMLRPALQQLEDSYPAFKNASSMSTDAVLKAWKSLVENSDNAKESIGTLHGLIQEELQKGSEAVGQVAKEQVEGVMKQSTSAMQEGAPALLASSTEYFNRIGEGASRADFENAIAYAAMTCGMTEDEIRSHYPIIAEVSQGLADSGASGFTESDLSAIFGNSTRQAVAAANQSLIDGSADMMASGSYVATSTSSQYVTSMKQGEASVVSATKSITNAAGTTLRNSNLGVDSTKQGLQITQGLNIGIKNGTPLVKFAVLSLGNQTKESLKSVKLQSFGMQEGNKLSSGTASGIRSGAPQAVSAASSMGNSAKNSLENVGLHGAGVSVGLNFARGFENGIRSGTSGAINAAASMARQSLQAAKNELAIHSPSRKTEYIGKMYDAGAKKGIEKNQGAPISAAKEMAKSMIGAMDVSAAFSGMRAAMNYNVGRFASRVLVSGQITGEANNSNNISDKELKAIGEAVAEVVNDRMEEFKFIFRDRELGRAVREVQTT